MNESKIPLLTDIVTESDAKEQSEDRVVKEPEISEPIEIAFDDSAFRIEQDIIVFEPDGARRTDRSPRIQPSIEPPARAQQRQDEPARVPVSRARSEPQWRIGIDEMETIAAELQTHIASHMYELTDDLMRTAFADFEARVFRQISTQLRELLPELIDSVIREQLLERSRESGEGD